eukprot:2974-Eustigmatos_ZCMA.PRE.1
MSARLGLPPRVCDSAPPLSDMLVEPPPRFGVDGLSYSAQDAQTRLVEATDVISAEAHEGTDRRGG